MAKQKETASTKAPGHEPEQPSPIQTVAYQPFPVEVLPDVLQRFITESSDASGFDPSFVALPLLAACGAAIGNSRRLEVKHGWNEPPVIWAVIVGDSGTMKSPALEMACSPLRKRQRRAMRAYESAMVEFKNENLIHEAKLSAWKKKQEGLPPAGPEYPTIDRCCADDTTIEALSALLLENPRGLLVARDELAGWFDFDRYNAGKGGDLAKWLEMFGARTIMVDRKTGHPKVVHIPRAAVCVTGGIQPATLSQNLKRANFENGLAARMLLAYPPRRKKQWTEAEVSEATENGLDDLFERLFEMTPDTDDNGEPEPQLVRWAPAGKDAWVRFYNEHADEHVNLSGDLSAAWSKLEGYAARLALVVHCVRVASGEGIDPDRIDQQSIDAGVTLSRWFGQEAKRLYAVLREDEDARELRELIEKIQLKGGSITTRELHRSAQSRYLYSDDAEAELVGLIENGYGRWETIPTTSTGGKPSRKFRLTT